MFSKIFSVIVEALAFVFWTEAFVITMWMNISPHTLGAWLLSWH